MCLQAPVADKSLSSEDWRWCSLHLSSLGSLRFDVIEKFSTKSRWHHDIKKKNMFEWLNLNHAGYFWAHEVWKESRRCLNLMRGEQWRLQRKMKLFKRKCLQLKFKLEEPLMFFFLSISRLIPPKILNRFHVNIIKILQDLEQPHLPGVEVTAAKAAKEHSLRFLFGTNWFSSSLKLKNLDLQRICGTCLETLNLEFRIRNKSLESKKIHCANLTCTELGSKNIRRLG